MSDIVTTPDTPDKPIIDEVSSNIVYKTVKLKELIVETSDFAIATPAEKAAMRATNSLLVNAGKYVRAIIIDGERLIPTGRFWNSLYAKYGLNKSFFNFFTHGEVFQRISERNNSDMLRLCIDRGVVGSDGKLLAATGLNKPVVLYDDLQEILQKCNVKEGGIKYSNGVVMSTHIPALGSPQFKIGDDKFSNQFVMQTPIDGFGKPSVFVSLLRWICSNGAIGFAKSFCTSLNLGSGSDDVRYALRRALESFSNEEGFAMMRDRFEVARQSWASIREHNSLYQTLLRIQTDKTMNEKLTGHSGILKSDLDVSAGNAVIKAFERISGNPFEIYRAMPDMMSNKRQRSLPMLCSVYDMINYASELATHYTSVDSSRQLQAWIGEMISNDYDLENAGGNEFDGVRSKFFSTTPSIS